MILNSGLNKGNWVVFTTPFHIPYFWCFDIRGPADPGETVLPRASQFLEIGNSLPRSILQFICSLSHSISPHHLLPLAYSHIQDYYSRALIAPAPDIRQWGISLTPWSLLKLYQVTNTKPAYSTLLVFPNEHHTKSLAHVFPLLSAFPLTPCSLVLCAVTSPPWKCEEQTPFPTVIVSWPFGFTIIEK